MAETAVDDPARGAWLRVTVERVPRRNIPRRRQGGAPAPLPEPASFGWTHTEQAPDGEWIVRRQPGSQTTKTYRCPGCDHEIRPGTPHVVAWPAEGDGAAERRHWHSGCWSARHRRGPTRRR